MAPAILHADLSGYAFSAAGLDTPLPLLGAGTDNLLDYDPAVRWVSPYLDHAQLVVDFGTATPRDTCVMDGHTLDSTMSSGTAKLQAADDGAFTAGLVTVVADMEADSTRPALFTFAPVTKRYWRVYFDGVSMEPPEVGQLFIEPALGFTKTQSWGHKSGNTSFTTTERVSAAGTLRVSQSSTARLMWELKFRYLTDEFRAAFAGFIEAVQGRLIPFYFMPAGVDVPYFVRLRSDYNPVDILKVDLNEVQRLEMATQRTRTDWYVLTTSIDRPLMGPGLHLTT